MAQRNYQNEKDVRKIMGEMKKIRNQKVDFGIVEVKLKKYETQINMLISYLIQQRRVIN